MTALEQRLFSAFKLKGVKVASVPANDDALAMQITARTGAQYLSQFLAPDDCIGVGWGWTLYEMAKSFPQMQLNSAQICQVTGSVDNAKTRSYAHEIVSLLASRLGVQTAFTLPCPAIVDNPIIVDTLLHDIKIREVLDSGTKCNKLFVNIALPDKGSCLYNSGYLGDADLENLETNNAVGSICCCFFNESGEACDKPLDTRTVGISIDQIKKSDCVMACISGPVKARATYLALKSDMLDVLVVDSITAGLILKLMEDEKPS